MKSKKSSQMSIQEKMFDSLILKYRAEAAEAEATLLIYFSNPVGIGEHPQHLEEMDKMVEKLTNANDKLNTINQFLNENF
jgi:hypothetical protein